MLVLALSVFLLALLLLTFALRGRVVERGVFCRRCRFDLSGTDRDAPDSRCPECGRAIGTGKPPRKTRRARSKIMGTLAGMLLMISLVLAGISLSGNAPAIYKHMPDRVVVYSAVWGSDPALDELLTRLSVPGPAPDWLWNRAIEGALAWQSDTSKLWDPRWGEIVSIAWQTNHLSEEQIARFVQNGTMPEIYIRNRYHKGDPWISYSVDFKDRRLNALNLYTPGYMHGVGMTMSGGTVRDKEWESTAGGMSRKELILPSRAGGSSVGLGSNIRVPPEVSEQMRVGDEFEVFIEFKHDLRRISDDTQIEVPPFRVSRTLTVVAPDEPIVTVLDDPRAAARIRENTSATSIIGVVKTGPGQTDYPVQFTIYFVDLPHSVAGKVYLRHPSDGEMYEAGFFSQPARSIVAPDTDPGANWSTGQIVKVSTNQDTPERLGAFQRVTRDGTVDIVFTTDPQVAIQNPRIHEIVQLDMEFRGVPLIWAATPGERSAVQWDAPMTPASTPRDPQP